jgi:hypothetical protein
MKFLVVAIGFVVGGFVGWILFIVYSFILASSKGNFPALEPNILEAALLVALCFGPTITGVILPLWLVSRHDKKKVKYTEKEKGIPHDMNTNIYFEFIHMADENESVE